MRQMKQKPEPFFVKRIRLRKSIIKTNEILEMISNYDIDSGKYTTISESLRRDQKLLKIDIKKFSEEKSDQFEGSSYHSGRIQRPNLKNMVKIYKNRNNNHMAMEMSKIGLDVRRIVGDPKHKRSYQFSCNTIERSKCQEKSYSNPRLNLTYSNKFTVDASSLHEDEAEKSLAEIKVTQKNIEKYCTLASSTRKNRAYLYQKMANKEIASNHQENHVYEKRIRSYTDFLWKCLLAHNVYLNLDLKLPNSTFKKLKAFVGFGNNCNMIKGLIKRRFWWSISQQMSEDCLFVWTQIKINKIYQRQQRAELNQTTYKDQFRVNSDLDKIRMIQTSNNVRQTIQNTDKKVNENQFQQIYSCHQKIWNRNDLFTLKPIFKKNQLKLLSDYQVKPSKNKSYKCKTDEISKKVKEILNLQNISKLQYCSQQKHNYYLVKPLVHNHLENNYFLGNKKALFYNLRQYYQKIGENVFSYLPLTFHIREGFKDPEYQKFMKFYEKRAKAIKQEERSERKGKMRNIWIVKPGQNSNQGRGITVIDELYELNHLLKQAIPRQSSRKGENQANGSEVKTFIVQLYIDRPFLYLDRKFDIRHYMLMTNIYGVTRAYWYEEGYIRTSSYAFNIHNFQPEIHLTNDAIQKKYPQYGRYEPYNKISYSQYQNYLNSIPDSKYNFKQQILPKMKKMGKDAARSVYTKISPQNQMHNFQIFGLDFMIDRNFKPWLIEINTNPCLDCTCPLLDRIIPYMVEQGFKLSLDIVYPPPTHYPNTSKHYAPLINLETFKYELIFDSLSEGQELRKLYSKNSSNLLSAIGAIEEDQQFKDNGKEIKLQDFT